MIALLHFPCIFLTQGHEFTVRQMALLAFRDLVLMRLPVEELLPSNLSLLPTPITQMLLILQVSVFPIYTHISASSSGLTIPTLLNMSREFMSPVTPQKNIIALKKCCKWWFLLICGTANTRVTKVSYSIQT